MSKLLFENFSEHIVLTIGDVAISFQTGVIFFVSFAASENRRFLRKQPFGLLLILLMLILSSGTSCSFTEEPRDGRDSGRLESGPKNKWNCNKRIVIVNAHTSFVIVNAHGSQKERAFSFAIDKSQKKQYFAFPGT